MLTVCTRYVNILYQNVSEKSIENQVLRFDTFFLLRTAKKVGCFAKPKFGLNYPLHAQCNPNMVFSTKFCWFIFGLNRGLNDLFSYG